MIKKLNILLFAVVFFATGCGLHPAFVKGEKNYRQEKYIEAVGSLKKGLADEPDSLKHKIMLKLSKRKGAKIIYEKAKKAKEKNDLAKADDFLRKALELDSQNELFLNLQAQIDRTRSDTKKIYRKAKRLLDQKKWDESFALLEQILPLEKTYAFIRDSWKKARKGSFEMHHEKGTQLFQKRNYKEAVFEFKLAMARMPFDKLNRQWYEKALAHLRAKQSTGEAMAYLKEKKYAAAQKKFETALRYVASFEPALKGRNQNLKLWAKNLFGEGREILKKGEDKENLHRALDKFHLCRQKVSDFKEVNNYINKTEEKLAHIYLEEGKFFLKRPQLVYISVAYRCLKEAERLHPDLVGLKKEIAYAEKLFSLRRNRYVNLKSKSPVVAKKLKKRIENLKLPAYDLEKKTYEQRLASLKEEFKKVGYDFKSIRDLPLEIISIKIQKKYSEKYNTEKEKINSTYLTGFHREVVPRWDRTKRLYQREKQQHAQLVQSHSSLLTKQQNAKHDFFRKDTMYSAISHYKSLVDSLYSEHIMRKQRLVSLGLDEGARREASNASSLKSHLSSVNSRVSQAKSLFRTAKRNKSEANRALSSTRSKINASERKIEQYFYYLNWQERERIVPTIKNYSFTKTTKHIKGKVRFWGEVKSHSKSKVKFTPKVEFSKSKKVVKSKGAKETDRSGYANELEQAFPKKDYVLSVTQQGLNALLDQVVGFLHKYHLILFQYAESLAKDKKVLDALEYYQLFMVIDEKRNPERYKKAKLYLEKHLRLPLKKIN